MSICEQRWGQKEPFCKDLMLHDIAIVGGGPVGLALNAALARQHPRLSCILFEPTPAPSPNKPSRNIFLNPQSWRIFEDWGVRVPSSQKQIISEFCWQSPHGLTLNAPEAGLASIGAAVSYEHLLHKLLPQRQRLLPAKLATVTRQNHSAKTTAHWQLTSSAGDHQARLLILADGAPSALAQSLGVLYTQRDYQQIASVATFTTPARSVNSKAWQFWLAEGVLTLVPRASSQRSYAVIMTASRAYTSAEMLDLLKRLAIAELGDLSNQQEAFYFPLRYCRAWERGRKALLIMGNAALNLHPMGAQNLNLHIRSVAQLMTALSQHEVDSPLLARDYIAATQADFDRTDTLVNAAVSIAHRVRARHQPLLALAGRCLSLSRSNRNRFLRNVTRAAH